MIRRAPSLALLLAGALLGQAVSAAIPRQPDSAAPLDDAGFRAVLAPAVAAARAQDCGRVLGLLDPVLPRVAGTNRTATQLLRLPCLGGTGRIAAAAAAYRELIEADPRNPQLRGIGIALALEAGDYVAAGNRLASLAEEDPAGLSRITGDISRGIVQALTEHGQYQVRNRLFIALARADWWPADRPDLRDSLAHGAIDALIAAGRADEAETLLPRVDAPELLADMAMQRHYARLWPAIEARMGAHGSAATDRFAAARLDGFASRPDDAAARRDAARSFILLGRFAEASEVASVVRIETGMSEAAVQTVRYDAQAIAATGRIDAAVARLRPFSAIDVATAPYAASGLVSLAELLDDNGREAEALVAARAALRQAAPALSPWGVAWLKRTEVCALAATGHAAEADRLGTALQAEADRNQPAAIEALLCLKRDDEAAVIAIAALKTPEGADVLADQFQPQDALWATTRSRLRELWQRFGRRPDVKAAFDKAARILPRTLWPVRTPRPIPRIARPGDVPVA